MINVVPILFEMSKEFHAHLNTIKSQSMFDLFSRLVDIYMVIGASELPPSLLNTVVTDFCLIYKPLASATGKKTKAAHVARIIDGSI